MSDGIKAWHEDMEREALIEALKRLEQKKPHDILRKLREAEAKVTITLELSLDSTWSEDCAVEQVYSQGIKAAYGCLANGQLPAMLQQGTARIIGEPIAVAVLVQRRT